MLSRYFSELTAKCWSAWGIRNRGQAHISLKLEGQHWCSPCNCSRSVEIEVKIVSKKRPCLHPGSNARLWKDKCSLGHRRSDTDVWTEESNAILDAMRWCYSDALDYQLLFQKSMSPVDPVLYPPVSCRYVRYCRMSERVCLDTCNSSRIPSKQKPEG